MTTGIIGFGKFARFIIEVLKQKDQNLEFKVFSRSNPVDGVTFFEINEISSCDIIVPTIPISAFEATMKQISPLLKSGAIVIDVCSVKVHPKKVMLENLASNIQIIATHPMFGPESYKKMSNSVKGFNMVIENVRCDQETFEKFKAILKSLELTVIEISSEEHDKLAAVFHFTTMFTGLMLKGTDIRRTSIDTFSAQKMHDFMEMVGDDQGILKDMYKFNPFCRDQLKKLSESFNTLEDSITSHEYTAIIK